ncbi:type III-B CRISPR-associated protein Cas10/Cmr2 [Limnohabitans sp. DM1]|uniref:type III-B CRISPR-associated protein Cas10/Cmr2 n=1 Tax=Limnohabitans sp. DM1 TaxID=1597955 RepID=UPI000B29121E|nr:type III-B CRISPR-associated protein Cas10/Cmr2 [Limnohabitans sp. DM1]
MTHPTTPDNVWHTKIAARIHDPAEKALVLMRDPAGHENGTSLALSRLMGLRNYSETDDADQRTLSALLFKASLPTGMYKTVQRADWWAAAADRPQWPMQALDVTTKTGQEVTLKVAPGSQVRFSSQPVLIHPLTGQQIDLGQLKDTEVADIKERSLDHHLGLLKSLGIQGDQPHDMRRTLLALWRFAPELSEEQDNGTLGALWHQLPADTRVPDHSIWDHLDLTSAFAGAFAADPQQEVALLTVSLGPVQSFIAAARSTSDLWAGSHLLSRLAWECMRPLCEALGPDAVLFPRLRGIPQVDLWLRDQMHLPADLFKDCEWQKGATDANPLFSAALPNRFVAVVPASQAQAIAQQCEQAVREWLQSTGQDVVNRLLDAAGLNTGAEQHCHQQMREQLAGFPEVHWATVPFSLIHPRNADKQNNLDTTQLSAAMAPFFGVSPDQPSGFLSSPAWQVLKDDMAWDNKTTFWSPNPGTLYPAVFDLAERALAAAKASRTFSQLPQHGWRCSLTGESEWLTTDPAQLQKSYRQQKDTLWAKVHQAKKSWAKAGEHLGGLSALKRLWPTVFADQVSQATGKACGRFVVSTHTMALASHLEQWLASGAPAQQDFSQACKDLDPESVALPRRLMRHDQNHVADAKVLPGLLEAARDSDDETAYAETQKVVRNTLGLDKLETYYSLIMMDGDRMGAILSGDTATHTAIPYRDSFHPNVQKGFDAQADQHKALKAYGDQPRAISPNRHLAISGALNDFSQIVVRHVVEQEHLGRVIYAGGDDVLAMLPTADLLNTMQRLRHAYSGSAPQDAQTDWGMVRDRQGDVREQLVLNKGFAWLNGRLMRMMGEHATASTGAIVAHHQAPLGAVLQELRAAEKRAKNEGGRNAFSITIVKRSGGALYLTEKWGEPVDLLQDLIGFLRADGTSSRAVFNSLEWMRDLPEPTDSATTEMLASLLAYQLDRQAKGSANAQAPELAQRLAQLCAAQVRRQERKGLNWLANFMGVAEFLARETRTGYTTANTHTTTESTEANA